MHNSKYVEKNLLVITSELNGELQRFLRKCEFWNVFDSCIFQWVIGFNIEKHMTVINCKLTSWPLNKLFCLSVYLSACKRTVAFLNFRNTFKQFANLSDELSISFLLKKNDFRQIPSVCQSKCLTTFFQIVDVMFFEKLN